MVRGGNPLSQPKMASVGTKYMAGIVLMRRVVPFLTSVIVFGYETGNNFVPELSSGE